MSWSLRKKWERPSKTSFQRVKGRVNTVLKAYLDHFANFPFNLAKLPDTRGAKSSTEGMGFRGWDLRQNDLFRAIWEQRFYNGGAWGWIIRGWNTAFRNPKRWDLRPFETNIGPFPRRLLTKTRDFGINVWKMHHNLRMQCLDKRSSFTKGNN